MCGIFGFSLKENYNADNYLHKAHILGLYNMTRGTDSAGVYYGGELKKSIYDYGDLIAIKKYQFNSFGSSIFIGHTRKSSVGAINEKNAHPFMINDRYVQVHNGTLKNHFDLAKKYGIDIKKMHVDSEILAACIEQEGFDVLSEYDGAAAIAATFLDEDDEVLYLFKGGEVNIQGVEIEERPLYALPQEEGIYFSSIYNSLSFINSDELKYKIEEVPINRVVKIKNGKVDLSYKNKVVRVPYYEPKPVHTNNYNKKNNQSILPFKNVYNIPGEDIPKFDKDNFIYYNNGRFYTYMNNIGRQADGAIYIDRQRNIHNSLVDNSNVYYFINGVMIDNYDDYNYIIKNDIKNNFDELLKVSRYPIRRRSWEESFKKLDDDCFYSKTGYKFNGSFNVKFSDYTYHIIYGQVDKATKIKKEESYYDIWDKYLFQDIKIEDIPTLPEKFFNLLDLISEILFIKNDVLTECIDDIDIIYCTNYIIRTICNNNIKLYRFLQDHYIYNGLLKELNLQDYKTEYEDMYIDTNRYNNSEIDIIDEGYPEVYANFKKKQNNIINNKMESNKNRDSFYSLCDKIKNTLNTLQVYATDLTYDYEDYDDAQLLAKTLFVLQTSVDKELKSIFEKEFIL